MALVEHHHIVAADVRVGDVIGETGVGKFYRVTSIEPNQSTVWIGLTETTDDAAFRIRPRYTKKLWRLASS